MRNELSNFRDKPIFVDANIFVYHAAESKYSESVTAFLEKVEFKEVEAYTSPSVIDEAAYVLIINKGLDLLESRSSRKVREKIENDRDFALKCYSVLEDFLGYVKSLDGLKLLEVTGEDAFRIYEFGTSFLLHPKDALHLSVMKRYRIFDIATNDSDFERVKWIKVWKP